jgi:GNAT superfamily N-acetyltransferase
MPDRVTGTSFIPLDPALRDAALDLLEQYYAEDGHLFDAEVAARGLDLILGGGSGGHFWFIGTADEIAGYVCLCEGFSLETGGGDFYLDELFVLPAHRSKGLGRAAIAFVEDEARRLGARRICLEVQASNGAAGELYHRLGYRAHRRGLMSRAL